MQFAFDLGWPDETARSNRPAGRRLVPSRSSSTAQPSLPGLEPERPENHFLGLQPDGEMADWLRRRLVPELQERRGLVVGLRRFPMFHVSLVGLPGLGGVLPGRVAEIDASVRRVAHPGFDVAFDRVMRFEQSGAVVLTGGEGLPLLCDLRRALQGALARDGRRTEARSASTPHLTLCYSKAPFAAFRVSAPRWRVCEIALIRSLVGRSQHVVLQRWPLAT